MLKIAFRSLASRWRTATLVAITIAMSVALVLSVERLRHDARTSFVQTISGTDLVVGARSGAIQLLLYSVFHIGNATNNISIESVEDIGNIADVDWLIPLSLGDSYRGYRVIGTSRAFFEHYRYGKERGIEVATGKPFDDVFDAVLGSEVASALGHAVGDPMIVVHGTGSAAVMTHENQPFQVAGILAPTGTPIDRAVLVSLEGIEAVHVDWQRGAPIAGQVTSMDEIRTMPLEPEAVTALLVGLKSRVAVFRVQRRINEYREEPLLAVLPGATLQELWQLTGVAENALRLIVLAVLFAGLVSLVAVLLAGLNERRREIAVLRASGARPGDIFRLLTLESSLLTALGITLGMTLHVVVMLVLGQILRTRYGIVVETGLPEIRELAILGAILGAGTLAGLVPAWRAYRNALSDGLSQPF
ncbi:MAG: peptide ABC transporter permease [Gammaproteobacteria bacterium]|nr:MAG: peptide ABC transporter permease [Gammaproteobacteria bacterium]